VCKICTKSPDAYKSASMADRPKMGVFGDGRFNGTMQNVVGPTLVAMATTFGLGAEIQSPTGLSMFYLLTLMYVASVVGLHIYSVLLRCI